MGREQILTHGQKGSIWTEGKKPRFSNVEVDRVAGSRKGGDPHQKTRRKKLSLKRYNHRHLEGDGHLDQNFGGKNTEYS